MKFTLNLFLITSTIITIHTFGLEHATKNSPLSLTSIKAQIFQDALAPRYPTTEPLDLASIRNMDATLKITGEDAQAKLAELASHLDRLKSLASLGIYWSGNYKAHEDTIKNALFLPLLNEHKTRMESATQAFANYMAIQALAVKDMEEKYAKEINTDAPTSTATQPRRVLD